MTLALALTACGADEPSDPVEAPELGACRMLEPDDVAASANSAPTVDCEQDHTAETYAVGPLPSELSDAAYDDADIGAFAYRTCSQAFMKFLGADESMALRTILSRAWFRPSQEAWDKGARWYRCDVVGGTDDATDFVLLPTTAKGLMSSGVPEDKWMACVNGEAVPGAPRIPCSEAHTWRAVTTIKVGADKDPYPGDRLVEVKSRDFCDTSVSAWLGYPLEYKFAYTRFHEAEWKTGNRRSICWARTTT
ncbi:septum formation family protein [Nocardioides sp. B-3]|uniref:septum formation family protein n=1 Tax=Nocardioides sp. B-3 TaxID=2895565 RepID=UPI0021524996|nr:septum formation family protein [Nocardioides sp. B-3]UUZ58539.1 septum formation family protein [Nocardioides sp. B-3]